MSNRMIVETYPSNPLCRQYHVNARLPASSQIDSFTFPLRENSKFKSLEVKLQEMLTELFNIAGVERVHVNAHSVDVHIGLAFRWTDIEYSIKGVIARTGFGEDAYITEERTNQFH